MQTTYIAIRDHLEQAQAIVGGRDAESRKLREVLQMVIGLVDELQFVRQHVRRSAQIIAFPGAAEGDDDRDVGGWQSPFDD
jgi:hypothetical protein